MPKSGLEGYETAQEAAARYGIDDSQVRRYCSQGRIPGAVKVGRQWLVPADAWPKESEVIRRPPRWANPESTSKGAEQGQGVLRQGQERRGVGCG